MADPIDAPGGGCSTQENDVAALVLQPHGGAVVAGGIRPADVREAWFALVNRALADRGSSLVLVEETPESAAALLRAAEEPAGPGPSLLPDQPQVANLQALTLDALADDLYDGDLHMLSLRETASDEATAGTVAACVIWRSMGGSEMAKWIDRKSAAASSELAAAHAVTRCVAGGIRQLGVDDAPIRLLIGSGPVDLPASLNSAAVDGPGDGSNVVETDAFARLAPANCLDEHWVKIEVLSTHRDYLRQGNARLLVASALLLAVAAEGRVHVVLQVAGGADNVAACSLYASLGFVQAPGGLFGPPNANMMVLFNAVEALRSLDLERVLGAGKHDGSDRARDVLVIEG